METFNKRSTVTTVIYRKSQLRKASNLLPMRKKWWNWFVFLMLAYARRLQKLRPSDLPSHKHWLKNCTSHCLRVLIELSFLQTFSMQICGLQSFHKQQSSHCTSLTFEINQGREYSKMRIPVCNNSRLERCSHNTYGFEQFVNKQLLKQNISLILGINKKIYFYCKASDVTHLYVYTSASTPFSTISLYAFSASSSFLTRFVQLIKLL